MYLLWSQHAIAMLYDIIFLGPFMSFFRSHDPVTMTVTCDVTLIPSSQF